MSIFLMSSKKRKKIILEHGSNPKKQTSYDELQEKSQTWKTQIVICKGLEKNCGDVLYLLIKKKNNILEKCIFNGKNSCLITIAVADMLCIYMEEKEEQIVTNALENCSLMIEGKKNYNLDLFSNLLTLKNIFKFTNRIECFRLVIRGFKKVLNIKN